MSKRLGALKHLPEQAVSKPLQDFTQAHAQKTRRLTTMFLFLAFIVVLSTYLHSDNEITAHAIVATTANITPAPPVNCTVPLEPGLNIISLNCISNFKDRDEVLNNTDTTVIDAIYEYRPTTSDKWRVYAPNLPSYVVSDLTTLSRLQGYLVYINVSQNTSTSIVHEGALKESSSINLQTGNNLVGFPSKVSKDLPEVLATINTTYTRVRTYNQTNGWIEFNISDGNASGLTNLTPLEGYWITQTASDTWEVNST